MIRNLKELGPCLQRIVSRLFSNEDLLKLLYYNDKDPYNHPSLTQEQIETEVYEKLVRIIPRVGPKETANSIIVLRVVNGVTNRDNTEFQNIEVNIEVFVPLTQWIIKDSNFRPFCIMGEINKSLNNKIIDGIGKLHGGDFAMNFLTEEMSCYEMTFEIGLYD